MQRVKQIIFIEDTRNLIKNMKNYKKIFLTNIKYSNQQREKQLKKKWFLQNNLHLNIESWLKKYIGKLNIIKEEKLEIQNT